MRAMDRIGLRTAVLAGLALALAAGVWAQSSGSTAGNAPSSTPTAQAPAATAPAGGNAPAAPAQARPHRARRSRLPGRRRWAEMPQLPAKQPDSGTASTSSTSGTASTASDVQTIPCEAAKSGDKKDKKDKKSDSDKEGDDPEPGTTPVGGDCAGPAQVDVNKVVDPGSQMIKVKPGSIEDVGAVGNREIGKRGLGNWYSTD